MPDLTKSIDSVYDHLLIVFMVSVIYQQILLKMNSFRQLIFKHIMDHYMY